MPDTPHNYVGVKGDMFQLGRALWALGESHSVLVWVALPVVEDDLPWAFRSQIDAFEPETAEKDGCEATPWWLAGLSGETDEIA